MLVREELELDFLIKVGLCMADEQTWLEKKAQLKIDNVVDYICLRLSFLPF